MRYQVRTFQLDRCVGTLEIKFSRLEKIFGEEKHFLESCTVFYFTD